MHLRWRFLKNAVANLGRGGLIGLVALVLPPVLVRHMTPAAYAVWVLILQACAYVGYLDFGLQTLTNNNVALFVSFFIGFCALIYAMKYLPVTQVGSLPFFNGITMFLACYFTGTFLGWFKDFNVSADMLPYAIVIFCAITAFVGGMLGAALGWFNVAIMFPREVEKTA